MAILVCFAGQIGSGKTSISTAVAEALTWKRASFGDFVRGEVSRRGGDPTHRETLQDVGQSLVAQGSESFCLQVLNYGDYSPRENFILDGIRHVDILRALEKVAAPGPVKLIFLLSQNELRKKRISVRDGSHTDLARADAHPVESDLKAELPALAAATIDGSGTFETVVKLSIERIGIWLRETH